MHRSQFRSSDLCRSKIKVAGNLQDLFFRLFPTLIFFLKFLSPCKWSIYAVKNSFSKPLGSSFLLPSFCSGPYPLKISVCFCKPIKQPDHWVTRNLIILSGPGLHKFYCQNLKMAFWRTCWSHDACWEPFQSCFYHQTFLGEAI